MRFAILAMVVLMPALFSGAAQAWEAENCFSAGSDYQMQMMPVGSPTSSLQRVKIWKLDANAQATELAKEDLNIDGTPSDSGLKLIDGGRIQNFSIIRAHYIKAEMTVGRQKLEFNCRMFGQGNSVAN